MAIPLSDELAQQAADAYRAHGNNKAAAAAALGLSRTTFIARLSVASLRGLLGTKPVLPGFQIHSTSTQLGPDGELQREWIQQKPESGEEFVLPAGHTIKGVSALVGPDDRVMAKWIKTREDGPDLDAKIDIIQRAFENFEPRAPYILRPTDCDSERLTAYIFCDWHLGLFAHGKETGGPDWDLSIAKQVLRETVSDLIGQSPKSKHAIMLGLGDILHADNSRNMTERSGNVLDVDTRYPKVLETACDLLAEAGENIAAKHDRVEIVTKPGNHDPESTVGIRQALRMYFRNTESVDVDTSPNPFYWRRFGVNLLGGAHGDKAKPKDMPLIMANVRRQDWSDTTTRHFHTGHIHHDTLQEIGGVHVYSHRAPVAQDAYHAANGYLAGRSMRSFNYHVDKGARGSTEIEIR
ncbi:hypothetical protein NKJ23_16110 [Mesorhizobium sp. M0184]|uniref:hypothetical protein n=2 Tax=unclassified Mesorhizobium TaxID=325217 RepID=UPI00333BEF20